jgi:hypothetical protein
MIEIQYELREKDLKAFNDHQLKSVQSVQKSMRRHQATIPGMLILIALVSWFYMQDSLTAAWLGLSGLLWGVFVPLYLNWSMRRKVFRLYSEEDKSRILGKYTLRSEPDELVEISHSGESRIQWKDLLRIEAGKGYAFIFVSVDSAVITPSSTVSSGNIREFFDDVEQRIEKAA